MALIYKLSTPKGSSEPDLTRLPGVLSSYKFLVRP
jgi:hypothetical protein